MIPPGKFSSDFPAKPYLYSQEGLTQRSARTCDTYGGVGLNDPSEGIDSYQWRFEWYPDGMGKGYVKVARKDLPSSSEVLFDTYVGSTPVRLYGTFDSNMSPLVAWTDTNQKTYLRSYDFTLPGFRILELASGIREMVLLHDDIRPNAVNQGLTDALVLYIDPAQSKLLYRRQRDRYEIERPIALVTDLNAKIVSAGMNSNWRLQIQLLGKPDTISEFLLEST